MAAGSSSELFKPNSALLRSLSSWKTFTYPSFLRAIEECRVTMKPWWLDSSGLPRDLARYSAEYEQHELTLQNMSIMKREFEKLTKVIYPVDSYERIVNEQFHKAVLKEFDSRMDLLHKQMEVLNGKLENEWGKTIRDDMPENTPWRNKCLEILLWTLLSSLILVSAYAMC